VRDELKPLPWHRELWHEITGQVLKQRLSHALLFAGPAGVGKRHFAHALAAFLLCENRSEHACGACRSCMQVSAHGHPNQMALCRLVDEKTGKEKRDISIDQVRELCEKLALTSHYGQSRIAIIDPVDALNQNGINALLKTIEEPPADAYLILISERSQALPATLRSRCQTMRFVPPGRALGMEWLAGDESIARDALEQAHDAPLLAQAMIESNQTARRQEWASEMRGIATLRRDPLTVASEIGKEHAMEFMEWLSMWLIGQLRVQVQQRANPCRLEPLLRETLQARAQFGLNGQPQLLVESVLILWWRLNLVGPK
jgi:DNA polymerase-3 subunit delta'